MLKHGNNWLKHANNMSKHTSDVLQMLMLPPLTDKIYPCVFYFRFALNLLILESPDNIAWKGAWIRPAPNQYLITNIVKEVSFKLTHIIYPAKHYLVKHVGYLLLNLVTSHRNLSACLFVCVCLFNRERNEC